MEGAGVSVEGDSQIGAVVWAGDEGIRDAEFGNHVEQVGAPEAEDEFSRGDLWNRRT